MWAPSFCRVPTASEIDRALREAALWCRLRADPSRPAESLRSPGLLDRPWPASDGMRAERCLTRRARLVAAVVRRRRALLEEAGVRLGDPVPMDGFAILVWPDSAFHEGGARAETDGFFDIEELPGHDTWVAYVPPPRSARAYGVGVDSHSRLIAWIPEAFRDRWKQAKATSMFDNFDRLPRGASGEEILAAAVRVVARRD